MLKKIIYVLVVIAVVIYGYIAWALTKSEPKKYPKVITEAEVVCKSAFDAYARNLIGDRYGQKGCRFHRVNEIVGERLYRGWLQYTGPLSSDVIMVFVVAAYSPDVDVIRLCADKPAFGSNEEISIYSGFGACAGADKFLLDYPHK